ncbi:hypothetical protein [Pseudomarimonas arenosa]|uniref:Photosynthesis system II assembly factor Ycf48/Hcf136-like domain-containing protein n=1 Tax=Pseudomarimonas arenosa TaxID=2774145 RepID=A0AAW3ZTD6_9GAMM|nr:hypothetical protein [Pseudomarimonas arenosa]MBD8528272.1 hypothetical protein [Pseudomarimonas arenosa]
MNASLWVIATWVTLFATSAAAQMSGARSPGLKGAVAQSDQVGFRPIGGPPGGFVWEIDFNPLDPSMVVATTLTGPAYLSQDRGRSWRRLETMEGRSRGYAVAPLMRGVGFDPLDADVIYRGTQIGLDVSIDRGVTWIAVPGVSERIGEISVAPTQPRTIIAVSDLAPTRILRSVDGGQTWIDVKPDAMGMVASSCEVSSVSLGLTVCPDIGGQVFVSEDFGNSWDGFPIANGVSVAQRVALHPSSPDVMWVTSDKGIHKSVDRGRTWAPSPREFYGPLHLRPAPSNPQRLYGGSGSAQMRRSDDGGLSWQDISLPGIGLEVHAMAVAPDDQNLILAGSVGHGILRSTDGGSSWSAVEGFHSSNPETVIVGPPGSRQLLAQVAFGQLWRAPLAATTWQAVSLDFHSGSTVPSRLVVTRNEPLRVYMTNLGLMSVDGGQTWSDTDLPGAGAFASHTRSTVHLMAVAGSLVPDGIYRRPTASSSWTRIVDGRYQALAMESNDGGMRAVGIISTEMGMAQVARSVDDGLNWEVASIAEIATPASPTGIAIDPFDLEHVLICTINGLHRSVDGGASFSQVAELPATECYASFDPVNVGKVVIPFSDAQGSVGVFVSADAGVNWILLDKGLSGARLRSTPLFVAETGDVLIGEHFSGLLRMIELPVFVDSFE